jgi:hypothetical protein
MRLAALALLVAAPSAHPARIYRDPVQDGASDASIVRDRAGGGWRMFYTSRRAATPGIGAKDVAWLHGTGIGVARSRDGRRWRYAGAADLPRACTGPTDWAPDVVWFAGRYHMWLTVVPGIFHDWNAPRRIVHLTSPDLRHWTCGDTLDLGSDRVIDADVARLGDGRYRIWYKDERRDSAVRYADSSDLVHWRVAGTAVDTPGEGPVAFRWRGRWWLIEDAWKGLLLLRSDDATNWERGPYLLADAGLRPTDRAKGHHADVVVSGDRAYLYYFTQQDGEAEVAHDPLWGRRSVIQVVELKPQDGWLTVDRNAPVDVRLGR